MSSMPEVTSVEGKVSVASHLLNLPSMATEAFTKNLTSLSSGVIVKIGPCAWASDGNSADAKRQNIINRTESPFESKQYKRSGFRLGYHFQPIGYLFAKGRIARRNPNRTLNAVQ